jgi:hypothetical protein
VSNPVVALESESATVTAPATKVSDTSASNGQAVVFGPASGGGSSNDCSTYPKLPSVKPTATTAGIPAGTSLTTYTGPMTITTDGTVIDGKTLTGSLVINANNVTVKNSKIHATGYYGITTSDGHTNVSFINNEIYGTTGDQMYEGILGDNTFVCGNYIHGFENGLTISDNMTVQSNFIEKLNSPSSSAHYDGIEVYSGSNIKIWGNNILMTDASGAWLGETGAINITPTWANVNNIELRGNWIGGGSFTLNLDEQGGYHLTNLTVTNNRWYGSAPSGFAAYGPIRASTLITTFTGNVWDTSGAPVVP